MGGDSGQALAQALDGSAAADSIGAQAANAVGEYAAACAAKLTAAKSCARLGGLKGIACRAALTARFRQVQCPGD